MEIKINNKIYEAKEGEGIFKVCKNNGIKIPTLCSSKEFQEGLCRICVVEINGKLMTSCNTKVAEGMEIITESENIDKARRINLELLWADHAGKCATCKKNRMCKLQSLAEEYKIENFHFIPRKGEITGQEELDLIRDNWTRVVVENENPCISRNSEFCVECRKCINVCPEKAFGFNHRGSDIVVGTPYEKVLDCSFCGECVRVCPTASLMDQNNYGEIVETLDDLKKFSVAVLDFGIEEKILEQIKIGISPEKDLNKLLINLGFEKIISLSEKDKDNEDEIIKQIKTDYAKQEKINPADIAVFFISSKIYKKKNKNEFLDYVLSEREVARLVRDKEKIKTGKIRL
ncbi:MAG TPA: 2Fe-2S iron-sulfur cluster-binding protein [Candidatus Moranbacteria bacterium]|nr:2Fe-2S iron-sulfur cluster-binding protein [Candidatus Moranbacteria bacterium]